MGSRNANKLCRVMGCIEPSEINGTMCTEHAIKFVQGKDYTFKDDPTPIHDESSQYKPKYGVWQHVKTKDQYEITAFGIDENFMYPVVIYTKITPMSSEIWVRPCTQFFDGRFVRMVHGTPRPELVDDHVFTRD